MNKVELVESYAQKQGISKKEAQVQVDTLFDTFIEGLEKDGIFEITKVIRVEKVKTNARKGRNPQTGEEISIPEGFKFKTKLLKRINDLLA